MPDQPQPPVNERFKAEMPQIPGVGETSPKGGGPQQGALFVVGGLAVVLVAVFVGGRLLSKSRRADLPAAPTAQIDIPASAPHQPHFGLTLVSCERGDIRQSPDGLLVSGFQLNTGRLTLERYDECAAAAGLELVHRWSTWDRKPYFGDDYAVSLHRRD